MKNVLLFLSFILLTSCFFKEDPTVVDAKTKVDVVQLHDVRIEDNKLVLEGSQFSGVKKVQITGAGLNETFSIDSNSGTELVASALKNISIGVNKVFTLILSDAHGSVSFQVDFSLEDKSITAVKLHDMGAGDGDVLMYNQTTTVWEPRPLNNINLLGTWDASTNTPALIDGGGGVLAGDFYVVNTAGATLIDGVNTWNVGDWIFFNGASWEKIANTSVVTSFNGRQGVVVPLEADYTLNLLGDVNTAGAAAGKVLKFNGTNWVVGDDFTSSGGAVSGTAANYTGAGSQLTVGYDGPNNTQITVDSGGFTTFTAVGTGTPGYNFTGGNVGIGNVSPGEELDVTGDIRASSSVIVPLLSNIGDLTLVSDSDNDAAGALIFRTGPNERIRVLNDGNVGIGTAGPTSKLHVAGSMHVDNNTLLVSGASGRAGIGALSTGVAFNLSANTNAGAAGSQYGAIISPEFGAAATTSGRALQARVRTAASAFTMADASAIYVQAPSLGAGSSITNLYGLFIENMSSGTTNNYAIYSPGTAVSHFGGNVGIGSILPLGKLHVESADSAVAAAIATADELVIENNADAGLSILTPNTNTGLISFGDPQNSNIGSISYDHANDRLNFTTNGATLGVHVDSAGDLGVGTVSPGAKLEVNGNTASVESRIRSGAAGSSATLTIGRTASDGDLSVAHAAGAFSNLATAGDVVLRANTEDLFLSAYNATGSIKFTNQTAGSEALRMIVLANGNVGIGATIPSQKLEVNGNVLAADYYFTSDRRLKMNIETLSGLELINQFRGVSYNWRKDGRKDMGVIAQEVEAVAPELVATNPKTGIKSVKYGNLVGPLIQAVKELYEMVVHNKDEQDKKIAALEARNRLLEERLLKLEAQTAARQPADIRNENGKN